jgi:hypothetical protein
VYREIRLGVVGFLTAASVIAGCGPVTDVADPSAPAPVTASPTATTAPPITDIPAAAFLQTRDLGKGGYLVEQGQTSDAISPCRNAPLRSDSMRAVREEVVGTYRFYGLLYDKINKLAVPDGYVNEVISSYRADGASVYLDEVREQVARCAKNSVNEDVNGTTMVTTWERSIVAENFAGDESLMWRRKQSSRYAGRTTVNNEFIAVIRLGDVVVLVHIGVNPGTPLRDPIDRLAATAVRRAKDNLTR